MSEENDTSPPPAIPVLSYAEPSTGSPAGTAFQAEEHPDGITFSKTLPAEPYMAIALIIVAAIAFLGGLLALARMLLHYSNGDGVVVLVPGILLLGIGVLLIYMLRITRARTLSISLRAGELIVINGPGSLRAVWTVKSPTSFIVTLGTPDLLSGVVLARLLVLRRFRLPRVVLNKATKAECKWLAEAFNGYLRS